MKRLFSFNNCFRVALMLVLLLVLTPLSASAATYITIERAVVGSSDDIMVFWNGTSWQTGAQPQAGYYDASYQKIQSGMRFTDVDIPQGATITSAVLRLYSIYSDSGVVTSEIRGEDANNAITFTTYTDFLDRSRTSTTVSWSVGAWTAGMWYESPDIKVVVQEIVNRYGWDEGNAMVLFWGSPNATSGGRRAAAGYEAGEDKAVRLIIKYTTSQSSLDTSSYTIDELDDLVTALGTQVETLDTCVDEISSGVVELNSVSDKLGVQLGVLKGFESRFDERFSTFNNKLDAITAVTSDLKTDLDIELTQIEAMLGTHSEALQALELKMDALDEQARKQPAIMGLVFVVTFATLLAVTYFGIWRLKK